MITIRIILNYWWRWWRWRWWQW